MLPRVKPLLLSEQGGPALLGFDKLWKRLPWLVLPLQALIQH